MIDATDHLVFLSFSGWNPVSQYGRLTWMPSTADIVRLVASESIMRERGQLPKLTRAERRQRRRSW